MKRRDECWEYLDPSNVKRGEQDDTGMLQKSLQMMQVNRHEQLSVRTTPTNDAECKDQPCRYNNTCCYSAALAQQKVRTTPTNDAECKAVPGINTGLPIVYDSSCPGLCCFEVQPCRYNNTGCYSAALAQQKVRTTPTNDAECKAVPGINTGLPIVYDSSCPGLCCFEDRPCRYNNTGCYSAALSQQKVRTTPTNDVECKAVPGINTSLPIVYDSSCPGPCCFKDHCPGLCCFEDQPCRYNNTGCYSAALAQQKVRTTPTNDAECKAVPGIHTDLPIVYDSSCPGVCCFEDQLCRYNNTGCYSAALTQQKVRTTPTNDVECKAVPGIHTDLPIVYDSSCPGVCCFEDQLCRYNNTGCYSAALAQQKVRTTPKNDAECMAVLGINTGLPIVYGSSCPGLCCFEDQPCRYNNTGCY
ncbi:unnamed protein product [Prorocentrum cordatum]|uniref:Uncharacterized protein n=1 Tax=Prorocentrum cordatum TaxID=2364126 RepID=A0ABN9RWA4_9DINO|nr:unnamed protein product [Polarella glacialis]